MTIKQHGGIFGRNPSFNNVGVNSVDATSVTAGSMTITSGNVTLSTAGSGIDFSATSGTGTSELLSDYEEGMFTPVITTQTSGSITLNASQDLLSYTKVGRMVHITGLLSVSSVSSPVGDFVTISLPFTSANLSELASATYTSWMYLDLPSYSQDFKPMEISKNTAVATLSIDASIISANEQLRFSFSYIAA